MSLFPRQFGQRSNLRSTRESALNWSLALRLAFLLWAFLIGVGVVGCASTDTVGTDSSADEKRTQEIGQQFIRMIREAKGPLSDPNLEVRVWKQYLSTRDRFREISFRDVNFPESFYNTARAYFAASGSRSHMLQVLSDAANDVIKYGGGDASAKSASYNAVEIQALLEIGAHKKALEVAEDSVEFSHKVAYIFSGVSLIRLWRGEQQWGPEYRSRDRYIDDVNTKLKKHSDRRWWRREFAVEAYPQAYLPAFFRVQYTVLLSQRYAAIPVSEINHERFLDDVEFVLAAVKRDQFFRKAYKRRGIPAIYLLLPFMRVSAELEMPKLYNRIWRQMVPFIERNQRLSESDLVSPQGELERGAQVLGATAGGLPNRFISRDLDKKQHKRLRLRFREWTVFDVALARWKASRRLGLNNQTGFRGLTEAFEDLVKLYEAVGPVAAKADGFERAAYEVGLARAHQHERTDKPGQALSEYRELVKRSETLRESLSPRLQPYFFQGLAKAAYQGVIRLEAQNIRAGSGSWDRFLAAVHRFRGRQLQEQATQGGMARAPTLASLQSGLRVEEALLISLDMDQAWITAVITDDRARLHVVDEPDLVRNMAREVRSSLVNGGVSRARDHLLELVLGDAAPLVEEHTQLGVMTSGMLSLVPLEAVRLGERMLVNTHRIRYFPILAGSGESGAPESDAYCSPVLDEDWQAAKSVVQSSFSEVIRVSECVEPWLERRWGESEAGDPTPEYKRRAKLNCARAIAQMDRSEIRYRVEQRIWEWYDTTHNYHEPDESKIDVCVEGYNYYSSRQDLTEEEQRQRNYKLRHMCRNRLSGMPRDVDYRLPAAKMYARHRQEAVPERRDRGKAGVLVVADPDYALESSMNPDTERLSSSRELRATNAGGYFTPLPETRQEAEAVLSAIGKRNQHLLTGEQANEPRVRSELCKQPEVLHFATHGILSGDLPGLDEAALVLAETDGEDGLLTTSEIADLRTGARLAVLSACNTGNGEQVSGEGLMGVSRAFLLSGTRQVVASLWPVDSEATVRLMTAFYGYIKTGRPPAAALRAAKQDMQRGRFFKRDGQRALKSKSIRKISPRHAYFWSPFVLITMPDYR